MVAAPKPNQANQPSPMRVRSGPRQYKHLVQNRTMLMRLRMAELDAEFALQAKHLRHFARELKKRLA